MCSVRTQTIFFCLFYPCGLAYRFLFFSSFFASSLHTGFKTVGKISLKWNISTRYGNGNQETWPLLQPYKGLYHISEESISYLGHLSNKRTVIFWVAAWFLPHSCQMFFSSPALSLDPRGPLIQLPMWPQVSDNKDNNISQWFLSTVQKSIALAAAILIPSPGFFVCLCVLSCFKSDFCSQVRGHCGWREGIEQRRPYCLTSGFGVCLVTSFLKTQPSPLSQI